MHLCTWTSSSKYSGPCVPKMIHVCGLVKFVPAVAYHFCFNFSSTFSQPHTRTISQPSMWLQECCRQVEAEVVSNSRNKLCQTTNKYHFRDLYIYRQLCLSLSADQQAEAETQDRLWEFAPTSEDPECKALKGNCQIVSKSPCNELNDRYQ